MKLSALLFLILTTFCSWLAAAELGAVSPEQLQVMQRDDHALIVDVRTPPEWLATGVIPHSAKLQSFTPEGEFNAEKWQADLQKLKASPDQSVILVCRSGQRSAKVGRFLVEHGMTNVYHLQNGIQSWIKLGHPVNAD